MQFLKDGEADNIRIPTFYVESEDELHTEENEKILALAPAGTIIEVNAANNFHVLMKMSDGSYNQL